MRTKSLALALSLFAVVLLYGTATRVFADGVQRTDYIDVGTSYWNACGFNVTHYTQGTILWAQHYDEAGTLIREIGQLHVRTTFSANGHSVMARTIQNYNNSYHPDGSFTEQYSGPVDFVVAPGQGPIAGSVGNFIFTLDESGASFQIDGIDYGLPSPEFCAALAP